jgi:tubulin alpha
LDIEFTTYYHRSEFVDLALEWIRKVANSCAGLQGFVILNAFGGGVGIGLCCFLAERFPIDRDKKFEVMIAVQVRSQVATAAMEPHFVVFRFFVHIGSTVMYGNGILYNTRRRYLDNGRPTYLA